MASLESCQLTANSWNFSEQDLNTTHGFDSAACAGGNHYMSNAYLARWNGPAWETDVPYPYGGTGSPGADQYMDEATGSTVNMLILAIHRERLPVRGRVLSAQMALLGQISQRQDTIYALRH